MNPQAAIRLPTIGFTVFRSDSRLSKRFEEGADRTIVKVSGVQFSGGTARRIDLPLITAPDALEGFGRVIARLSSREAVGLGVARNGEIENTITTMRKKANGSAGIARALANFTYPEGKPGLLLVDGDGVSELRPRLISIWSPSREVGTLTRPSASSGIRHGSTGELLLGAGEHLYAVIDDVARSREALDALMRLAWLAGQGFLKVSAAGTLLVRSCVDALVGSPERLSYEGAPEIVPPIEATCERRLTIDEGGIIKVAPLIADAARLVPEAQFAALKADAVTDAILEEQREAHAAYVLRVIARKVEAGVDPAIAEAEAVEERQAFQPGQIQSGWGKATLSANDVFEAADGRLIRLSDVLAEPEKFDRVPGADPGEGPSYGRTTAMLFCGDERGPFIRSHAHGGVTYKIARNGMRLDPSDPPPPKSKNPKPKKAKARAPIPNEPNWRERKKNGDPAGSMHNARLAVTAIGVECSYDTFHDVLFLDYRGNSLRDLLAPTLGKVSDDSVLTLRRILSDMFGFDLTERHMRDAVKSLALEHAFDPVADMLAEAEENWDGVERLDTMAPTYLNTEDTPFNRAGVRKWMIAGVARVRHPGIKFDTVPVLEAPEGFNKSTSLQVLAGKPENFSDETIIGKNSREMQEALSTVWIHENAELGGMKKAEVEMVKAFASRTSDRARPAYGHFLKDQPRHSIEAGTTNSDRYLQSQTGNRRFWPMKVLKSIDIEQLKRDRLQLWGEAAHWESHGESLVLPESLWADAAIEQEARRVEDLWEDMLDAMPPSVWVRDYSTGIRDDVKEIVIIHEVDGEERVAGNDIITYVLKLPPGQIEHRHSIRIATVMKKIGWQRPPNDNKITIGGRQHRGYFRPIHKPENDEGNGK